jgi:hypothetical protein
MSLVEVAATVIAAFFVIGIGVGVLLVSTLTAFRRRPNARGVGWEGDYRRRPRYDDDARGWEEPPGSAGDDTRPRWPGGTAA